MGGLGWVLVLALWVGLGWVGLGWVKKKWTHVHLCGLLPQHVHSHRLITYCSHFLLNFQLPTGFVLVAKKIIIIINRFV